MTSHLRRIAAAATLGGCLLTAVVATSAPAAAAPDGPTPVVRVAATSSTVGTRFGTLVTAPQNAATEHRAGLDDAMMELSWAQLEPQPGVFDTGALAAAGATLDQLLAAGDRVTLGLGVHYTPSWVLDLPDGRYVDQYGDTSGEADVVYSQSVRDAVAGYLDEIAATIGFSRFAAIRLTSGGDMEMLYPSGGAYWAFSDSAQTGAGLPATMTSAPDPGWRPGTTGATAAQERAWLQWYVGGLDDVADWQMHLLDGLGFTGKYQMVTPGSGVRPDGITPLVAADLPDGVAGVGAVWQWFYGGLDEHGRVTAYVSSVADGSGDNDGCRGADRLVPLDSPDADSWSATRWIARIAEGDGMTVAGENPGFSAGSPAAAFYRNSGAHGMAQTAVRQAVSCHFSDFYWAHDDRLFDGTVPFWAYRHAMADGGHADRLRGGAAAHGSRRHGAAHRRAARRAARHRAERRRARQRREQQRRAEHRRAERRAEHSRAHRRAAGRR